MLSAQSSIKHAINGLFLSVLLLSCVLSKDRQEYITLADVIPEGKIISETEGIIEYKNIKFILGLNDLKRKKELIESLKLLSIDGEVVIDMRFSRQIILRQR